MKHLAVAKKLLEKGYTKEAKTVLSLAPKESSEVTAAQPMQLDLPVNLQKKLGDKSELFDRYTKGIVNEMVNGTKTIFTDIINKRKENILKRIQEEFGKKGIDDSKDLINNWIKYVTKEAMEKVIGELRDIIKTSITSQK